MKLILIILRVFFNIKSPNAILIRSCINRLQLLKNNNYRASVFKSLLSLFILFFSVPLKLKKTSKKYFVYKAGFNTDERLDFLMTYRSSICDDKSVCFVDGNLNSGFYYHELNLGLLVQLYGFITKAILSRIYFLFFVKTQFETNWYHSFVKNCIQILLTKDRSNNFFFFSYTIDSYLSALYSDDCTNNTWLVVSNSPVFAQNRYTYLPSSNIVLCSKYQLQEIEVYIERGWISISDFQLWGLEESSVVKKIVQKKARYDIGIYSSAEWARSPNLNRIENVHALREGNAEVSFLSNYFTSQVLLPIIELQKKEPELTLKIFAHPYERYLALKEGIYPPYLPLLKKMGIDIDFSDQHSLLTANETLVGVSIFSSIIFDRFHLGLNGILYDYKDQNELKLHEQFDARYLGSYAQNCVQSSEGMIRKLQEALLLTI